MLILSRRLLASIVLGLMSSVVLADAPPVSLGGPEVFKLDWNTRSIIVHDLNGDGRLDLAVINNDRARIDLLIQKKPGAIVGRSAAGSAKGSSGRWNPVLEDARFDKQTIVTGGAMFALAAGDLDADGRADLVFTGQQEPLVILYQGPGNDWSRRRELEIDEPAPWSESIAVRDVDGDDREDLIVLTRKQLLIYPQNGVGEPDGPKRYPLTDENCFGLGLRDLDDDGRLDISYLAPNSEHSWRIRFRTKEGGYGPEIAYRFETPGTFLRPLSRDRDGHRTFATVRRRSQQMQLLALASRGDRESDPGIGLRPRVHAMDAGENRTRYALGDLDGDRREDLVAAGTDRAQVRIYLRRPAGGFAEPQEYPTLPDVRSMAIADIDGDRRAELFVLSSDESAIGVSRMTDEGRLSYPTSLPTLGRPLALVAGDFAGDDRPRIAYLYNDGGKRGVAILDPADPAIPGEGDRIELSGLRTDPTSVRALDVNRDGRPDLAVFTVQSPVRILVQRETGGFRELTVEDGFRPGLVDNLPERAMTAADLSGEGRPVVITSHEGFARSLTVDSRGAVSVLDQFNARDGSSKVAATVVVDLDDDGVPEILLAIDGEESLQVLRRDPQGVFRYEESLSVGAIDLVGAEVLEGKRGPELLLLGKDRFWWIPVRRDGLEARGLETYETAFDDVRYSDLAVGDLNDDGVEELVVIDATTTRMLEVLAPSGNRTWDSVLHFTVFETDPHYEGRRGATREPRELLIADLTGDGLDDLLLLVHDRILLYPQLVRQSSKASSSR